MMFPRYFLSLCALFFFAAIVCAEVQVKESSQNVIAIDEVETRNPVSFFFLLLFTVFIEFFTSKRCGISSVTYKLKITQLKKLIDDIFTYMNVGRKVMTDFVFFFSNISATFASGNEDHPSRCKMGCEKLRERCG